MTVANIENIITITSCGVGVEGINEGCHQVLPTSTMKLWDHLVALYIVDS